MHTSEVAHTPGGVAVAAFVCPNCDAAAGGEYCSRCGQERLHADHLSLKHAWHHVAHELLHVDGRILNTALLLFTKPGQLTLDYLEGRRQRHVSPLRMFLLIGAVYFVAEAAPYSETVIMAPPMAATRQTLSDVHLAHVIEQAHVVFKSAFIGSVVVNGLVLWAQFRRRYPYVVAHMVTALHLASVWMPILLLSGVLGRLLHRSWISGVAGAVVIVFTTVALRRVYGSERAAMTGVAALVMYLLSLFLPVVATLGLLLWAAHA